MITLSDLFSNPGFMPHIHCYLDRQPLVWTMLLTDLLIGVAYVGISLTLWVLFRRIRLSFSFVIICFGVFIGACGATHFMEVWTLWHPNYWMAAFIKVITALASVGTAIYLYRLRHQFIALADAAKLAESQRLNLESLTHELESRVAERTRQLTENEKRYNQAMRAAQVGVWEWDLRSNEVIWNGENSQLYDLDLPPDTQQNLSLILNKIHNDDRELVQKSLNIAASEHREVRVEFRVLTRDGRPRWLMAIGRAEYDESGTPTHMFGVNTDVTERKLAEQRQTEAQEKLKQSEENFKLVANSIPQLAWMTNAEGYITWYNQRWYDFTGTTLEDMQGWGWTKVHDPEHTERVTEKWLRHLKSGEDWEDTFPLRSKDGQYCWFLSRAHASRDQNGKITRWFGTNTDVTKERLADAAVKESEKKFRDLANSMPAIVWSTNADGVTNFLNARWFSYTGDDPASELSTLRSRAIHPEDQLRQKAAWEKARATRSNYETEIRIRAKNGEYSWFLSRAVPILDPNKNIQAWFGTSTNIDDQKKEQSQLQDAIRSRDHFLSIASHELKTPLTSLQLQVQMRQRELKRKATEALSLEKVRSDLEDQLTYIQRISRLVDDILDVTRMNEAKLKFHLTEFDFCVMVTEVVQRFKITAEKSNVELSMEGCAAVHGHWDRFRLEQVVLNLLTNALRYGKNRPIHVRVVSDASNVILSVRDEGIGIQQEDQERIFQRFERAISENEISGLGLGLFITKEIVSAHQGRIQLRSKMGEGSEFIITLPILPMLPRDQQI